MLRSSLGFLLLALGISLGAMAAPAADRAFVGVLALAVDPSTAEKLGLTDEQKSQLLALIDKRELEIVEKALEFKDLPAAERTAKLAPFVAESETLGLALLSEAQKRLLGQLRIAQAGVAVLADEAIAATLKLEPTQREAIGKLIERLGTEGAAGSEDERRVAQANLEREIVAQLSQEQRAQWEGMMGKGGGATSVAQTPPPGDTAPATPAPGSSRPGSSRFGGFGSRGFGSRPDDRGAAPSGASAPGGAAPGGFAPAATGPAVPGAPRVVAATQPAAPVRDLKDVKLKFQFRFTPWKDVLDWMATQSEMSLVAENPPQGTFNYTDNKEYTPDEAINLLNSVLLTKGFTLIRRDRMLILWNIADGRPPDSFVPQILAADLDKFGEFEMLGCLFALKKLTPEEAAAELNPLKGPQGAIVILPKSRQIHVTELAGKLRTMRAALESAENPVVNKDEAIDVVELKHLTPSSFMQIARPLLGIGENLNVTPDQSLRVSLDELGGRLLVSAKPDSLKKLQDIVALVDKPLASTGAASPLDTPQLESYPVGNADPQSMLNVVASLVAGQGDVKVALDPKANTLIIFGPPKVQATVKATVDQLQGDGMEVLVVKLRRTDPQTAVLVINKLFGGDEKGAEKGPKVEADTTNLQLLIRGTKQQVAEVRKLLGQMGEVVDGPMVGGVATMSDAPRSNVRMLNVPQRSLREALDQLEFVWPTMRANKIRVITPAASNLKTDDRTPAAPATGESDKPAAPSAADAKPQPAPPAPASRTSITPGTLETRFSRIRFHYVSQPGEPAAPSQPAPLPAAQPQAAPPSVAVQPAPSDIPAEGAAPAEKKSVPGAEIVVRLTPQGVIIASEDLDALDEFEETLRTLLQEMPIGKEYSVFYLKHAKAEVAATLLKELVTGASSSSDSGGGSLMGDIASSMLGDVGGGLFGGLLGMGGGSSGGSGLSSSGSLMITPDIRLNALIVQAAPRDLDSVEQLLKVIDQPSGPESVQTTPPPRFIPVVNTPADQIAQVVRDVYSNRMTAAAGQQRQPSPEDFIRALRGGRGGAGSQQQTRGEEQKMTIGVDTHTNSLIVSAPDYLFEEVKALVARLDVDSVPTDETVRIVSLRGTNADVVTRTLGSVFGDSIKTNTTGITSTGTASRPGAQGARPGTTQTNRGSTNQSGRTNNGQQQQQQAPGGFDANQFRQMQNALQRGGGFPGGGFGGGGSRGGR